MRFRVVAGSAAASLPPAPGLRALHRSPGLVIEGSEDVVTVAGPEAGVAFVAGHVVGLIGRSGALSRVSDGTELAPVLFHRDVQTWRERIEGRYLIARVDGDGSCLVTTDRFGQTDVFVQAVNGATVLATDASLLSLGRDQPAYDQTALAHALCVYGYRPPKRHTVFAAVRRLGVDEWVRIEGGCTEIHESPFRPVPTGAYGPRELEAYGETLLDAVGARGSRFGNVVYLSSGWDSTALLACLVRLFGARKVRGVIGRMHYAERSGIINQFEIDRARAVADYFGVRLDIVELDYRHRGPDLVERVRSLLQSHQFASMTVLNHALLAEFVARTTGGDETVFAGEISDGAHNLGFSQFTTIFHPVLEFREYSDKMASYLFGPTFLGLLETGRHATDPVFELLRGRHRGADFDAPAADRVELRKQLLASFFLRSVRVPLWSLRNQRLLTDAGRTDYQTAMEDAYLTRPAEALTPATLYAWYLHLYNSFHWQSSTVATIAVTAEALGLRTALPFWDSRIQEFLAGMPESWGRGLDLKPTKYPLKWFLQHRIDYPFHLQVGPHSYLYDVDPAFSHGAEVLYGSSLGPYFRQLLQKRGYEDVLSPDVFDLRYVETIVDRYLAGVEVRGAEMNDLLSVCLLTIVDWHRVGVA